VLLGLAGLAGAGKTTAIATLERFGFGRRHYAGQALRDEVQARGLALTADNERAVRSEMRERCGMDVFARLALPRLRDLLAGGPVLLDSIYCMEERDLYQEAFGSCARVVAVRTSHATREGRLALSDDRPMTGEQLARRDALELGRFRLGEVIESANYSVANEGPLNEFEETLRSLLDHLTAGAAD
jgi:dephospho-CoA kinase